MRYENEYKLGYKRPFRGTHYHGYGDLQIFNLGRVLELVLGCGYKNGYGCGEVKRPL